MRTIHTIRYHTNTTAAPALGRGFPSCAPIESRAPHWSIDNRKAISSARAAVASGRPMAALDSDIEKLLPAALYKKGFDLCAAFSTKAYNDTTSKKSCTTLDEGTAAAARCWE